MWQNGITGSAQQLNFITAARTSGTVVTAIHDTAMTARFIIGKIIAFMRRAGIATLLIGVIALTAVCCVLQEPAAAAAPHRHQTLHHATVRISVRHLDIATLADLACGEPQSPLVFGHFDRRGCLSSHTSRELVTPLRI
jgi:hypothetical protein